MILPLPLALRRALDLTTSFAGATASRWLADFGVEVIMVERPGSERDRSDVDAATVLLRNKFACLIDPSSEVGKDLCLRLASICDIVLVDLDDPARAASGLDYEAFSSASPGVIVVSIGDGGARPGVGVVAVGAALSALFHRRVSGEGQLINVSFPLVRTSLISLPLVAASGGVTDASPDLPVSGVYRCAAGSIAIVVRSGDQLKALSETLGRAQRADSAGGGVELRQPLSDWLASRGADEAATALLAAGIAAQTVLTPEQLLTDPHLRARGFLEPVAFEGEVREVEGVRLSFSRTPGHVRTPAAFPGEHNAYVLGDLLGLSSEEIGRLSDAGVVGRGSAGAQ
jgi:crotonobetainyl-CoA:carnitine CoA-transferase CaiB-like acyl-CoA transferase